MSQKNQQRENQTGGGFSLSLRKLKSTAKKFLHRKSSSDKHSIAADVSGDVQLEAGSVAARTEVAASVGDEIQHLYRLIAHVATGLWRIRRKMVSEGAADLPAEMAAACRHLEATMDVLKDGKVEIRDHANEKYVTGMALKVVAFQPTPGIQFEMIAETIRPSVFYRGALIQRAEVIVATPEQPTSGKECNGKEQGRQPDGVEPDGKGQTRASRADMMNPASGDIGPEGDP